MADKKSEMLVLTPEYLAKAGIELSNAKDAAAKARAALIAANNGKGFVPQNKGSDIAVQVVNYVREELSAGESAMKHVCVALASIDMAGEYANAQDASGKPYTSMLGFAMDLLPNLSKSTVAGYMAVGKKIYVPAIRNRFGAASKILLELAPSTLDAVKANLGNDDYSADTIEAIKTAAKQGTVTQRLAKGIAKIVRDAHNNKTLSDMTAAQVVKAAKGDSAALKIAYPDSKPQEPRTGGATKNGGNKDAQKASNTDAYNAVKARMKEYLSPVKQGENVALTLSKTQMEGLCGLLKRAMVSNDENDARAVLRAILETISG